LTTLISEEQAAAQAEEANKIAFQYVQTILQLTTNTANVALSRGTTYRAIVVGHNPDNLNGPMMFHYPHGGTFESIRAVLAAAIDQIDQSILLEAAKSNAKPEDEDPYAAFGPTQGHA
jgi:hypothetical protein